MSISHFEKRKKNKKSINKIKTNILTRNKADIKKRTEK